MLSFLSFWLFQVQISEPLILTCFLPTRIPFYPWIRAAFLLYLIAPQTQGARILYQERIHPFLHEHEVLIDDFISSAHDRAKTAGLNYLKHFIELLKEHVLGLPPRQAAPPPPQTTLSYAQSLIARFNLPTAAPTSQTKASGAVTSTATDFYTLLASAVSAATSGSPAADSSARDLSNSGTLIPPTISGADRMSFIATQRERLSTLLSALDREALSLNASEGIGAAGKRVSSMSLDGSGEEHQQPRPASAMSGLSKSRSEVDFEKIEREDDEEEMAISGKAPQFQRQASGSWMPWSWVGKAPSPPTASHPTLSTEETIKPGDHGMGNKHAGKSSGVDI